ncbi:MAG: glycoside hydrolase family 32 protein [Chloroflexi bacterium]|nr:glycoside hydrolase family 32 protein [Chloroflexota bacterium]
MSNSYRPAFHFTPPANWMNDPNGMVWHNGVYHLFYQHHPHSMVWGPMHWGHAISRDLIHWQHLPIALYPDEHGMIFSGSAVVDWKNTAGFGEETLVAIFTYNKNHIETQNLAYSLDHGKTWKKYAGNPVIGYRDDLKDCRDPKVFWYEDHWVMVLAAGKHILFYVSPDLKHWDQSGVFDCERDTGDGIYETPDLFQLPVDGSYPRWVLTVGVAKGAYAGGSGTQYFIGNFDGRTFKPENPPETSLWMDHGADYYAPQSWNNEPNGRRLMLGWMSNWQYATLTPATSWRGAFSIIREISLKRNGDEVYLSQQPIPEMRTLRGKHTRWLEKIIEPNTNLLADIRGTSLEIIADFKLFYNARRFGVRVRVGKQEQTTICYETEPRTLSVDRTRSGRVDFHDAFAGIHSASLLPLNDVIRLHIFVDVSSVEVFANDGLLTFTDCIFPAEESQGLELFVEGGDILLLSLDLFQLKPA